jgi:hypothetical protein
VLDARITDGMLALSCEDSFLADGFIGGLKLKIVVVGDSNYAQLQYLLPGVLSILVENMERPFL